MIEVHIFPFLKHDMIKTGHGVLLNHVIMYTSASADVELAKYEQIGP